MRNVFQKMKQPARLAILSGGLSALACAQSAAFPGFTAGNLVLSRSVYQGTATTVTKGQPLPPVCPATAACGKSVASDNGAGPSTTSTNNVWNNDGPDGSFGVTSPIFLDQITPTGTLVNTLPVPTNLLVTSFSSKSEGAINLSSDGTAITVIDYVAPVNTIDVSNGNTPGVYDPTNPAGGSYYRAVLQIGANGAMQVTPTNAYSGNNGRAAILANGMYYIAGNSNNGSGTPANVVAAGGVQIATPGQSGATPPQQVGGFSISQLINPATGAPYATDKAGKDNNYRGLTVFNNTLYVTKGSGSNGVDTVYQVGAAGSLPTLANAASAPIAILPGFPQAIAKTAGANNIYPFGIWFANATTLYVADEGDGTAADAAGSQYAGLQKWTLLNGVWHLDYVLQKGLNLGVPYSVPNYPTSLNPATDGLRNITGRVNADGTVTIWGITSTVSTNGDQGADPNKLVTITDLLAYQTPAAAAYGAGQFGYETFTTIRTANAGEVLRGISLTPVSKTPMANVPSILSAASPSVTSIAPGGLAFAQGASLPSVDAGEIVGLFPGTWGGTNVTVTDSTGASKIAPLAFVSPTEITFEVPASSATGLATVTVNGPNGTQTSGQVQINTVAPALFTMNGSGLAAATAISLAGNGTQTPVPTFTYNTDGSAIQTSMNVAGGSVYLTLYGTGFQAAGTAGVKVSVNGVSCQVVYAGPSGIQGVDQVNLLLPASLAGKGNVNILLTANGVQASAAEITVQ